MGFETIHNYYEKLVSTAVQDQLAGTEHMPNQDVIDDITCVALNQLPARYVRHTVDLVFYMSADERDHIDRAVNEAVRMAIRFVTEQADAPRPHTFTQGATI
jgi:competence protein ComFB